MVVVYRYIRSKMELSTCHPSPPHGGSSDSKSNGAQEAGTPLNPPTKALVQEDRPKPKRQRALKACVVCRRRKARKRRSDGVWPRRPSKTQNLSDNTNIDTRAFDNAVTLYGPANACSYQSLGAPVSNLIADTEKGYSMHELKMVDPLQPVNFTTFSDYVLAMSVEMLHLEEHGFLIATAVVIVLQETRVQRLLLQSQNPTISGRAYARLRECRETIKRQKARQSQRGITTQLLDSVLNARRWFKGLRFVSTSMNHPPLNLATIVKGNGN
ncbi:uncharacterized protein F4822DRAFT_165618 [Hypoxylon trugodes]|uniref:uncharacterized protein n=1 Tax=Hypoxylon trugodes TaxID=326681 RepID=UPI0021972C99|nr:uncharacterized protein F4822DRAFT_165618 [Hypoxylon trugodes]KAI1390866.1 hypothetical protein F4822DRAFT_165618 [Hypoxylon trugodes]